jgi:hypothetical protein
MDYGTLLPGPMKQKFLYPLTLASLLAASAAGAAETNQWRLDTSLNLFLAGLSGDVTVRGQPADLNLGFGDIAKNLKFAAAGRVTVGYDRWSLSTEFSYMGLGASKGPVRADMDQWLVEPSVGYRFCEYAEGFAGARYNNLSAQIRGPFGRFPSGTQEWWDPIIGLNLSLPLVRNKLSFDGRFDVGGFGAGSDFTWQAYPHLNWRFARWGSVQLGYRWLGTDYQTGSGASLFKYDVIAQGPQLSFTVSF